MNERLVVYTVCFGRGYDLPPTFPDEDVDYICFSDHDVADSQGWEVRVVKPVLPEDLPRSSRDPKIRPHKYLTEYDRSLYVDSKVLLTAHPTEFWEQLMPESGVIYGGVWHPSRSTIRDEFLEVERLRLDSSDVLAMQVAEYRKTAPWVFASKPVKGTVIARRHHMANCVEAMEIWFDHVKTYSRRDQLSLLIALERIPLSEKAFSDIDVRDSKYLNWPRPGSSRPRGYVVPEPKMVRAKKKLGSIARMPVRAAQKFQDYLAKDQALRPKSTDVSFGFDEKVQLHYAKSAQLKKRIFVSDEKRLMLYARGFLNREAWLLRDYCLGSFQLKPDDIVVDIGANIGELGIWASASNATYLGFEPDPVAFRALSHNLPGSTLFPLALGAADGELDFFLNSAEADSSLFQPGQFTEVIRVSVKRLDDVLNEHLPGQQIRLLKVEAEGWEPEILTGATHTLRRTQFVAVDAGPERGGEHTVAPVLNHLFTHGFSVIDCFLARGTFLLEKSKDAE